MRKLLFAAAAVLLSSAPALAGGWQEFAMTHNQSAYGHTHYHYFGDAYRQQYDSGPAIIWDDAAPTEQERRKAIADERTCAPVVMYTDEGRVVHPALGCRR